MTLTVLVSPGGAPGVTTTALALTLTWPRPALLAECDPAGGTIVSGLWGGATPTSGKNLLYLAVDLQQGTGTLDQHTIPLDDQTERHVLPGVPDPAQSRQIAPMWPAITAAFTGHDADVIADAGRYDAGTDLDPLFAAADAILMVLAPVVRQVTAARPRLAALRRHQARSACSSPARDPTAVTARA